MINHIRMLVVDTEKIVAFEREINLMSWVWNRLE